MGSEMTQKDDKGWWARRDSNPERTDYESADGHHEEGQKVPRPNSLREVARKGRPDYTADYTAPGQSSPPENAVRRGLSPKQEDRSGSRTTTCGSGLHEAAREIDDDTHRITKNLAAGREAHDDGAEGLEEERTDRC